MKGREFFRHFIGSFRRLQARESEGKPYGYPQLHSLLLGWPQAMRRPMSGLLR